MSRIGLVARTLATRRLVTAFDKVELVCDRLSVKRLWTWAMTELTYAFKWEHVWTMPTHLQIEPTNQCNLRCPVCHVVTDTKPQGRLRFDDYCKILNEVGDSLLVLNLWGWGEPFLNPDIFAMIRYARSKGIKVVTSTNGHSLENKDNVHQLLDAAPDILFVALDGVDRATYEKYRQNGDWARVIGGLRLLVRCRAERGLKYPRINLRMLLTKDTESQVRAMQALAQEIGVDALSFKTLNSFDNPACGETLIPTDPTYRRFAYDHVGKPIRVENRCKKLWNHPTIYRDGTVVLCDYYTGGEFALGNVLAGQTFSQLWFGTEYRRARQRFAANERAGLRCDNCSLNYADLGRSIPLIYRYR